MANVEQTQKMGHSSRVKFSFVSVSASWFLVSMYLIWILGSKLILVLDDYNSYFLEEQ